MPHDHRGRGKTGADPKGLLALGQTDMPEAAFGEDDPVVGAARGLGGWDQWRSGKSKKSLGVAIPVIVLCDLFGGGGFETPSAQ